MQLILMLIVGINCPWSSYVENITYCSKNFASSQLDPGLPKWVVARSVLQTETLFYRGKKFKQSGNKETAHLLSPMIFSKTRADLKKLDLDENLTLMDKNFHREGLWKETEEFELEILHKRGGLVTIAGRISDKHFFKIYFHEKSNSVLSLLLDDSKKTIEQTITPLKCIEKLTGSKFLKNIKNYEHIREFASFSLDYWQSGYTNHNSECKEI